MPLPQRFRKEPEFSHGQAPQTGVLYCNLGTPDAPTAAALRRYLAQFLSDPRVVEIPRPIWLPLLYGLILPFRSAKSAAKYQAIWTPDGSPLKLWTDKQARLLQGWLGEHGQRVQVRYAMRYGSPSIASQLDALKAAGATRILILPAYPQYSGTTTASIIDAVAAWSAGVRNLPELRFANRYHDHDGYVQALVRRVHGYWQGHGRGGHLGLSFSRGAPRTLRLGDPYHCECQKTARMLASRLALEPDQYSVTFQSRFGKAKWLEPYTEPSLRELARRGLARVDVMCPGFTSDCLETLEEIAQEGRAPFIGSGGKEFPYIPCLNDEPAWSASVGAVAQQHLAGWPAGDATGSDALARSRERAVALGAPR